MQYGYVWRLTAILLMGASWIAINQSAWAEDSRQPDWKTGATGELPAVSQPNGKLELGGGLFDADGAAYGAGSFSLPLGHSFGAQFDGFVGSFLGDPTVGAAGHLFWRDPAIGLLGIYGSHAYSSHVGGVHMDHAALEGEFYHDRLTLSGMAGAQFGDLELAPFTLAELAYYLNDEFQVSIGHNYADGVHGGEVGLERQVARRSQTGLSLFGNAGLAEGGNYSVLAGFRLYFGADKSLVRRHREDDPRLRLPTDLFTMTSQNVARAAGRLDPPLPPSPTATNSVE